MAMVWDASSLSGVAIRRVMWENDIRRETEAARASLDRIVRVLDATPADGGSSAPEQARHLIEERERRDACFPPDLLVEYRWAMLLTLYVARGEDRQLRLLDLFNQAAVPHTTGKRIIEEMAELGLLDIIAGGSTKAKKFVALSEDGSARMERFLAG